MAGTVETLRIVGQYCEPAPQEEPRKPPLHFEDVAAAVCLWTAVVGFFSGMVLSLGVLAYGFWQLLA